MSTEIIQRKKSKRTFDEIVTEIRTILSKTKAVYIREMCEALRDENPDWENKEIQRKVESTCDEFGWNQDTVYEYLPGWIHNQTKSRAQANAWERRHKQELEQAKTKFLSLSKVALKPANISAKSYSIAGDEEPDLDVGEPMLETYGENTESALTLYANINKPMRELFEALTKRQLPNADDVDMILEYLKPSREYRKGIFYEVEQDMRASLYNAMVYTRDALNDTIKLLDDIDKK